MVRRNARTLVCALLALLVLLNAPISFGQAVTGNILGRVTDSTGAVVPGASVQIQNVDTGFAQTVQSDSEGRYSARNLPLGTYSVTVQQTGFRTEVRSGIALTVASEINVNVQLAVGNVSEKVEVTAEAPTVETNNATISGLVSQDQIRDLPLNGRSVDKLALLSPGVITHTNVIKNQAVGVGIHMSVNGSRPDSMLYLLDGTVVNDATNNGHGSAAGQTLGVEGILEFRLLSHSFSAEYGRNAGGVISAVTRAGTNELHGSVYEFVRNNIFDARNFFNTSNAPAPSPLPPFRRNQFGASAGGRIVKDRVFFFSNYEGLRQRQGVSIINTVPNLNARNGDIPGQPHININPVVLPYLKLYPLPNGTDFGDGTAQYRATFSAPSTEDYTMQRMDFRLTDKDNFYFRNVFDPSETTFPESLPNFATVIRFTDHLAVMSETHIFSGASLNEFRASFNRSSYEGGLWFQNPVDPSLSFVPGRPLGAIQFAANGIAVGLNYIGTSSGALSQTLQNSFEEADTFSTVRGAHSIKIGLDLVRQQINNTYASNINAAYQFAGLPTFLTGIPTQFRILLEGNGSTGHRGWRRDIFGWFIQDDYRVRPNLTLNLGLRHEFLTAPREVNNRMSAHINATDPTNTPGSPFYPSKLNFAPRAGLAWDPTGSGKTAVRVGGGLFFNHIEGRTWVQNGTTNADFLKNYQISSPVPIFPNALTVGLPAGATQSNYSVEYHPETPTVIQYNFEVQRQLRPTLSLRVGFVGSHGYHLTRLTELNLRIPQIQADGTKFFPATVAGCNNAPGCLVNPAFASMQSILTDVVSSYNGLQVVLQKTFSAGLTFQASYTYAKALSDADLIVNGQNNATTSDAMDPQNIGRDYGPSVYDQRHIFVWNGVYQMPWDKRLNGRLSKAALGGWAINGIFSYGSGTAFNISTGFNNSRNGDNNASDRPDLTPGFSNNPINGVTAGCTLGNVTIPAGQKLHTPDRWYDPCAFSLPAIGLYGNLGRNTLTAPGLKNADITLVKLTPLTEKKKLEFRAEFFNVFNHANFGLPLNTAVFTSGRARVGNSGQITTTTTDNRDIQFGLKLVF